MPAQIAILKNFPRTNYKLPILKNYQVHLLNTHYSLLTNTHSSTHQRRIFSIKLNTLTPGTFKKKEGLFNFPLADRTLDTNVYWFKSLLVY